MSRSITVTVLLVLGSAASSAVADGVSELLLPILHLEGIDTHGVRDLDPWKPQPGGGLAVQLHDEDQLRRYVDGVKVADLASRRGWVTARLPLPGAGNWLQLRAATVADERGGRSRDLDWTGALSTRSYRYQISWDRATQAHRWVASIAWARQRGGDRTVLRRFHRSPSDSRMNLYFWDRLQPTIGERVHYTWDSGSLKLDAAWVTGRTDGYRGGLQISWYRIDPDIDLAYTNTGPDLRLQGPRRAAFGQRLSTGRLAAGLERRLSRHWRLRGEVGYAARRYESRMEQMDIPESESGLKLDILELGWVEAEQRGPQVALRGVWRRNPQTQADGYLGFSRARIEARGAGDTPVLGFRLRTLPISHGGDAALEGRLRSWAAGIEFHHRRTRAGLDLGGMVVQSDYRGRTQANAQMQFGLVVAPVDRRSRYRLRLLRLSAAPWMRLGERLDIQYRITQYAGSLRDRETEARLGDADSESRGGRIHGLTARHRL